MSVKDSCPHCIGGQLAQETDYFGTYIYCLQCGYHDISDVSRWIHMPDQFPVREGHLPPEKMRLVDSIPLQTTSEAETYDRIALTSLKYEGTASCYSDRAREANETFFIRHGYYKRGYHKWALAHPNLANSTTVPCARHDEAMSNKKGGA